MMLASTTSCFFVKSSHCTGAVKTGWTDRFGRVKYRDSNKLNFSRIYCMSLSMQMNLIKQNGMLRCSLFTVSLLTVNPLRVLGLLQVELSVSGLTGPRGVFAKNGTSTTVLGSVLRYLLEDVVSSSSVHVESKGSGLRNGSTSRFSQ